MNEVFYLVTDQPDCINLALEFFFKKWNNLKEM